MEISKYRLASSNLDQAVNYLVENLNFDYENHSSDMSVLTEEEFHFRTTSSQLNMIVARRSEDFIFLDIIGSAGGSGIFNFDFWSEQGYINKVRKVLDSYCEEYGLTLEVLPKDGV